jgi:hypothetical protein
MATPASLYYIEKMFALFSCIEYTIGNNRGREVEFMKRIFVILLLACLLLTACKDGSPVDQPSPPLVPYEPSPSSSSDSATPPTVDPNTEESLISPDPSSTTNADAVGLIAGDMYYKDMEVSLLFEKPFAEILGEPLEHSYGPYYFYDDLEISSTWNEVTQKNDMAASLFCTNLSVFKINGIALDMTRSDLIAAFGNPIYYLYPDYKYYNPDDPDDYRWLGYHIELNLNMYRLEFWFDDPDKTTYGLSIRKAHM